MRQTGIIAVMAMVAAGLQPAAIHGGEAAAPAIIPAPAFTAQELLAPPTAGWITNGGTLYNQRHSPLKLINRDNVGQLRALWRTAMGSGTSQGHAGQAQILAHEGVLYVINGACDVFALQRSHGV